MFCVVITNLVLTEGYKITVSIEEIIGTAEMDGIDGELHKPMTL